MNEYGIVSGLSGATGTRMCLLHVLDISNVIASALSSFPGEAIAAAIADWLAPFVALCLFIIGDVVSSLLCAVSTAFANLDVAYCDAVLKKAARSLVLAMFCCQYSICILFSFSVVFIPAAHF